MPSLKNPCTECKGKHLKCDEQALQCHRCRNKGLQCVRPGRKRPFRHGSSAKYDAQFLDTQSWVNSNAREFRLQTNPQGPAQRIAPESEPNAAKNRHVDVQMDVERSMDGLKTASPQTANSATALSSSTSDVIIPSPLPLEHAHSDNASTYRNVLSPSLPALSQQGPSWGGLLNEFETHRERDRTQDAVQEACLLRYYVNELAHWFDICDPQSRFRFLVPERARKYQPLRFAIFAVSARHLCRLPELKTSKGIVYHGQLLPNLTPNTAVEYMLKCIPVLKEFHETRDEETRELIVTTAVILRQFEEMEDEDDEESGLDDSGGGEYNSTPIYGRVNFLAILNAVLRSSNSADLVQRLDLLNASYWIALRQEVYFALRKGYAPQMVEPPVEWADISPENKLVIHTSQVAKWRFDGRSETEWQRLKQQEKYLYQHVVDGLSPILSLPPDRAKGEVFPAIWYSSTMALTGMQHLMVAKMILTAESPFLGRDDPDARLAYREAEGEVRSLVLDVCGIALQHPGTPPAMVNAALGIQLYGSYFTDPWDREALKGIVQRFKEKRAWPVPKALQLFK
ncbi:hypothetical protein B0J13DRAFT_541523 [Dactylonectria estremocensis]|uniref:Zn(2)-C6 fungal-type domain-containing protein n=1 Tax=Dactylonectria estremocensis TaxID=1079267 RepID=A0A9P9FBF5_9HYPO|nr:hypothetical protein B0J13DRAFT_541523 [Dactylonectria estremocensis]